MQNGSLNGLLTHVHV